MNCAGKKEGVAERYQGKWEDKLYVKGWLKETYDENNSTFKEFEKTLSFKKTSDYNKIVYKGRFYVKKSGPFKFFVANPYETLKFEIDS